MLSRASLKGVLRLVMLVGLVSLLILGIRFLGGTFESPPEGGEDGATEGGPNGGDASVPNAPPRAHFTWTPENPLVGEPVTFDASGSHDPDGSFLRFRWSFGAGVEEETTAPKLVRAFATEGTQPVELTVVDENGGEATRRAELLILRLLPFAGVRGYGTGWETPDAFLITNTTRWEEVWSELHWDSRDPPVMDFTRQTVVAVFSGARLTFQYYLEIVELLSDGEMLRVRVNHSYPNPGVLPAQSHPYDMVVVDGSWERVSFGFRHNISHIGGHIVFGAERPAYEVGSEVTFSLQNHLVGMNLSLYPGFPGTVYSREQGEWSIIASPLGIPLNLSLQPGESFRWHWLPQNQTENGEAVPLPAGFYRVELWIRAGYTPAHRFIGFFEIV